MSRKIFWEIAVPVTSLLLVSTGHQGIGSRAFRSGLPLRGAETFPIINLDPVSWILGIIALLAIISAVIIIRIIIHQLRKVTIAAENISSGQFDQQIQINSGDQVGKLALAFNKMSANLKNMMATISDEKTKLETILSTMADGVIMTDSKGNIMLINQACESLFNIQVDKVIGKPLIEVIINYEIDNVLRKCIETNRKQVVQIDTTSGQFLRVIAAPVKSDIIPGVLILFQDLSEMRSLQTMRREFIGNVSHELRTPLAAIKAIVDTLQDGAINDQDVAKDFLSKINFEIDSMTQMVNELIEISRVETGKARLNLEPVNLRLLIGDVITHLTPQAERKMLNIAADLEDLPTIQADREKIQQVITNILHNAIKFTPAQGKIIISDKLSNNKVIISITDTGIGISKEDLTHIFERFFKADKSRSSEGSGLGLAVAKHIVQAHGGEIRAESQEGEGSTFSFSIPLSNPDQFVLTS